MAKEQYKEDAFEDYENIIKKNGFTALGTLSTVSWLADPKRVGFVLARYKFVSKMLSDYGDVLEIGCGDAFGSVIVANEVQNLTCTDYDKKLIYEAKNRSEHKKLKTKFEVFDFITSKFHSHQDAIYCLDVFEHIPQPSEDTFLRNIVLSLKNHGVLIVGIPSLESQKYASKGSKIGHVNCKSGDEFKRVLKQYFFNVFLFSMNDEVVHTGFYPMGHYLIAVCSNKKKL